MIGRRNKTALERTMTSWQAGAPALAQHGWKPCATNANNADRFARCVLPTIRHMRDGGMSRLAIMKGLKFTFKALYCSGVTLTGSS